jgi:hypothetical protein
MWETAGNAGVITANLMWYGVIASLQLRDHHIVSVGLDPLKPRLGLSPRTLFLGRYVPALRFQLPHSQGIRVG